MFINSDQSSPGLLYFIRSEYSDLHFDSHCFEKTLSVQVILKFNCVQ